MDENFLADPALGDEAKAQRVAERMQAAGLASGLQHGFQFRAAVRPGIPAEKIDAEARGFIAAAGYGEYFTHRVGHGIGLEAHEDPYMVSGNATQLQPGMAFSVEPGIYLPGRWGVRLENVVMCTEAGSEVLNRSSLELRVVRG